MEKIEIYEFQLKDIQEALRLTSRIHESRKKETCFDRTVDLARRYTDNALAGDIDKEEKYV